MQNKKQSQRSKESKRQTEPPIWHDPKSSKAAANRQLENRIANSNKSKQLKQTNGNLTNFQLSSPIAKDHSDQQKEKTKGPKQSKRQIGI